MIDRASNAIEHHISPWLRLLMPLLMALGLWILNGLNDSIDDVHVSVQDLTIQYHEVDKKVNALEIRESNINRIEGQINRRLNQHDDRFKNFSGRISKNEQFILIHQRDRHAPTLSP